MRYQDLSPEQKAKFRDANRDWSVDGIDWWDGVYGDFLAVCQIVGVVTNIRHVVFSGFWSQGDGASFAGSWRWRAEASAEIRQHAPEDTELHRITDALTAEGVKARLCGATYLGATISRSDSMYCHSGTMNVEFEIGDENTGSCFENEDLEQLFRDLADWLYENLENEYEHLTSDDHLDEALADEEIEDEEVENV